MADTIKIEILEDGTISITTDGISGQNHVSADQFLNAITKNAGGERNTTKRKDKTAFHHHHETGVIHAH